MANPPSSSRAADDEDAGAAVDSVPLVDQVERQLVVVGGGAGGLYTALCAARTGARVTLISATPLSESSSYWAQGGLAAALADEDSADAHFKDTLVAGRELVRDSAARVLTLEAPTIVEDLSRLGVEFDTDQEGRLEFGLEGGHGKRRIVHAGGAATGRRIVQRLSAVVAADDRIEVIEGRRVNQLMTHDGRCIGVWLEGGLGLRARATVLATGGAAALWSRTTNPAGATGSGMQLAYRAGAALADIELMQFHPTAVARPGAGDGMLVTEAIRGEGAKLLNGAGERFVDELAPRDEVAKAIYDELTRSQTNAVALDMRNVKATLFPSIVSALRNAGLDPENGLIPVAPAAHYMMGGIATDLDARSSLPGLFAVGECSCTGLHGANRLASNSLTECFVFGARAARAAVDEQPHAVGPGADRELAAPLSGAPAPKLTDASRRALWRLAGLERSGEGLRELERDPHDLVRLIARAALAREESRGAHWRSDFPQRSPELDHRHVTLVTDRKSIFEHWA